MKFKNLKVISLIFSVFLLLTEGFSQEVKSLDKRKYIAWTVDHMPYHILVEDAIIDYNTLNTLENPRVKKKKVIEVVKELKTVINNNDYDLDTLYYFNDDVAWEIALRNKKENDLVKKIDGLRVVAPEYYNMKEK